jgi:hypothetical protein
MAGKFDHLLPTYTPEELATEEWKIVSIDGRKFYRYAVSNLGRIKNIHKGTILKQIWCHAVRGEDSVYWRIYIKGKWYLIHRLVSEAFVSGRTKRKKIVHHKDHCTYNPRANNLEWVTNSKNAKYYHQYKKELDHYVQKYGPDFEAYKGDGSLSDLPEIDTSYYSDEEAPF